MYNVSRKYRIEWLEASVLVTSFCISARTVVLLQSRVNVREWIHEAGTFFSPDTFPDFEICNCDAFGKYGPWIRIPSSRGDHSPSTFERSMQTVRKLFQVQNWNTPHPGIRVSRIASIADRWFHATKTSAVILLSRICTDYNLNLASL